MIGTLPEDSTPLSFRSFYRDRREHLRPRDPGPAPPAFFSTGYWKGWSELTGCNIIAFDAPFHGENRVDQSYQDFAAHTVAQARELVDTPLVVAGVSQGGVIAQESAGRPGVVGVIGISTTRRTAGDEERESMTGLIDIWGVDGGPQPVAENIAATSTNSQQPAYDETVAAVRAMTKEQVSQTIPLLEDRRGGIELVTPYLFIHGTADQTYAYEDIVADAPADRLVTVEDGSHSMTRNSPEIVAAAVREFALGLVEGCSHGTCCR